MPTVNLITAETQGVDMQVNPLFLGLAKVHSATNMVFEEGRIHTRPGFRYLPLGLRGQFQGASTYAPSKGISFKPFSPEVSALISVVSGTAHVNDTTTGCLACLPTPICETDKFRCAGDVHVFQAENYLILQSPATNTYWWTGEECAVESPGIEGLTCEPYVYRPPVDRVSFEHPPCPQAVTITVRNSITGNVIPDAEVVLTTEFLRTYNWTTSQTGIIEAMLHTGTYTFTGSAEAFADVSGEFKILGPGSYFIDLDPNGIEITVRIVDEETGAALSPASLELKAPTGKVFNGFTSFSGDIVFDLFPAEFKYVAASPGYVTQSAKLVVDTPRIYTIALRRIVIIPPPGEEIIITPPIVIPPAPTAFSGAFVGPKMVLNWSGPGSVFGLEFYVNGALVTSKQVVGHSYEYDHQQFKLDSGNRTPFGLLQGKVDVLLRASNGAGNSATVGTSVIEVRPSPVDFSVTSFSSRVYQATWFGSNEPQISFYYILDNGVLRPVPPYTGDDPVVPNKYIYSGYLDCGSPVRNDTDLQPGIATYWRHSYLPLTPGANVPANMSGEGSPAILVYSTSKNISVPPC